MKNDNLNYSDALKELEEILSSIEGDDTNIDTLSQRVSRATELIKFCRSRLLKVEEEVNGILEQ